MEPSGRELLRDQSFSFANHPASSPSLGAKDPEYRGGAPVVPPTLNQHLLQWVAEVRAAAQPISVHWCNGTPEEWEELADLLVAGGTLQAAGKGKYTARSDPRDDPAVLRRAVAGDQAGGGWEAVSARALSGEATGLLRGSMVGRTMYVVPLALAPAKGYPRLAVLLTDHPLPALQAMQLYEGGFGVLREAGSGGGFLGVVHTVGVPCPKHRRDVPWPFDPDPGRRLLAVLPGGGPAHVVSHGTLHPHPALHALTAALAGRLAAGDGNWTAEPCALAELRGEGAGKTHTVAVLGARGVAWEGAWGEHQGVTVRWAGWPAWMRMAEGGMVAVSPASGALLPAPAPLPGGRVILQDCHAEGDRAVPDEGRQGYLAVRAADWPYAAPSRAEERPLAAIVMSCCRPGLPLCLQAEGWEAGVTLGAGMGCQVGDEPLARDPLGQGDWGTFPPPAAVGRWLEIGLKLGDRAPKLFLANLGGESDAAAALGWVAGRLAGTAAARRTPLGWVPQHSPDPDIDLAAERQALRDFFPERAFEADSIHG